jgi:predicted site-specific integrase-resolvase
MSLDKFIEQTGWSAATVWRYRKKGMLTTVNIYGRQYILRSEIARFNARAAAGEFAKDPVTPKRRSPLTNMAHQ